MHKPVYSFFSFLPGNPGGGPPCGGGPGGGPSPGPGGLFCLGINPGFPGGGLCCWGLGPGGPRKVFEQNVQAP